MDRHSPSFRPRCSPRMHCAACDRRNMDIDLDDDDIESDDGTTTSRQNAHNKTANDDDYDSRMLNQQLDEQFRRERESHREMMVDEYSDVDGSMTHDSLLTLLLDTGRRKDSERTQRRGRRERESEREREARHLVGETGEEAEMASIRSTVLNSHDEFDDDVETGTSWEEEERRHDAQRVKDMEESLHIDKYEALIIANEANVAKSRDTILGEILPRIQDHAQLLVTTRDSLP
ncbi:hypothetical protein BGX38DRAFT_1334255 [Terfezia claveryi]|nr:hypothetical protein BGX38DRAFT_1334255 [Terfezia claveryi]